MDWLTKNELIHPYLPRVSPTAAGKPAAIRNWTRRAGPSKNENWSPFNQNPNPKSFFQDFSPSQIRRGGSNHA